MGDALAHAGWVRGEGCVACDDHVHGRVCHADIASEHPEQVLVQLAARLAPAPDTGNLEVQQPHGRPRRCAVV